MIIQLGFKSGHSFTHYLAVEWIPWNSLSSTEKKQKKECVCACFVVLRGKVDGKGTQLRTGSKAHIVSTLTDIVVVWGGMEQEC